VNVSELEATFTKNKPAVLGVAAVAVVGLGLYHRKKAASVAAADPGPVAGGGTPGLAQSYGLTGAGGVYDSSASDLFGAVSPQLESLQTQLSALSDKMNATPVPAPVASPVAAPPPAAAPTPSTVPVPAAAPTGSGPQFVTAKAGDTLSGIAAKYREAWITPQSIAALNGVANVNRIYAGTTYRIY
jgi:LysM repeat protein